MTTFKEAKTECEYVVDRTVRPALEWYQSRSRWPRILFRTSGVLVIMGSLLLPVLAVNVDEGDSALLLTVISLVVATLTALSTFFRWDISWRGRVSTALKLRGLLDLWEVKVAKARLSAEPARDVFDATEMLVSEANSLVGAETEQFFTAVKWPASREHEDAEPTTAADSTV